LFDEMEKILAMRRRGRRREWTFVLVCLLPVAVTVLAVWMLATRG